MSMQKASCLKWMGLTVSMALLAGCVINPYVKTAAVPRNDPIASTCKSISASPVAGANARDYAECVRRTMESKAGRYAWMNNGGGALLMQMAGFAGYSGVRGGHQAQVAAFTTGGASLYGAQQYLYRKPREAIYWSGSNAIGCAIGITERRVLVASEAAAAALSVRTEYAEKRSLLDRELRDLQLAEARIEKNVEHCDKKTNDEWNLLQSQLRDIRSPGTRSVMVARRDAVYQGLLSLESSSGYAHIDLIATANAIRDTVNRQLAIEQPDPAELSKLLSTLKLTDLVGYEPGKKNPDVPPGGPSRSPDEISGKKDNSGVKPILRCDFSEYDFSVFRSESEQVFGAYAALDQALDDMRSNLAVLEKRAQSTAEDGSQLKYCTLARTNTLMPFGLQLAQQGVQKVAEGQTLSIAIGGGVPPFSVAAMSADSNGITAIPKDTDDGGYKIEISAVSAKKDAKSIFFASDAAGAGTVFAVEVVAK